MRFQGRPTAFARRAYYQSNVNPDVLYIFTIFPYLSIDDQFSLLPRLSPNGQRVFLGENLYPLVQRFEHRHTSKVTGMIMELPHYEILHLIKTPYALQARVAEAVDVLRRSAEELAQYSANRHY